jgi:hypothetical protein
VHSSTDVWVAGSATDPANSHESLSAVSHWNGARWTTLGTAGTDQWQVASIVAAGPDDVWVSGGLWPWPPYLGEVSGPLLAHWNGKSWTQASTAPFSAGFVPSLSAAPSGQPAWATMEPYYAGGVTIPNGCAVFLKYSRSAWTLSFGPVTSPAPGNPTMYLAAVPGSTRTLAVGTAPYLFDSSEPVIESTGG